MAYNKGDRILDKVTIATGPNTYLWFDYKEVSRNGTNVTLKFWAKADLQYSSSYRSDASHLTVTIKYDKLNDDGSITAGATTNIYNANWKAQKTGSTKSGTGWPAEKGTDAIYGTIKTVSSKCYVAVNCYDATGAKDYDYDCGWKELVIPAGAPILNVLSNSKNCNSVTYSLTNTINTNVTQYRLYKDGQLVNTVSTSGISFTVPITGLTPGSTISGYSVAAYSNNIWGDQINLPSVTLETLPTLGGSVSQNSDQTSPTYEKYCFILWEKTWLDNGRITDIKYTIKNGSTILLSETQMTRNQAVDNTGRQRAYYDGIEYYVIPVYNITDAQSNNMANNNKTSTGTTITFEVQAKIDGVWYSNSSISGRKTGTWYFSPTKYKPTVGNVTSYGNVLTKINEIISSNNTSSPNTIIFKKYNSIKINYDAMTVSYANASKYRIEETNNASNYKESASVNDRSLLLNNGINNSSIKLSVYDSRGYSANVTKNLTIVPYSLPTINSFVASRVGGVNKALQLYATGTYTKWSSNYAIQNSFPVLQYYVGNSGWKDVPGGLNLKNDGTWVLSTNITDELTLDESANSQLRILDVIGKRTQEIDTSLGTTKYFDGYQISSISTIPTGKVMLWRDLLRKWLGIGKKPTCALDVNGDIKASGTITSNNIKSNGLIINNKSLLDLIYPIGSIYICADKNMNPGTLFGGTWDRVGGSHYLMAYDPNNNWFDQPNNTTGSNGKSGNWDTDSTVAPLPKHSHSIPQLNGTAAEAGNHRHNYGFASPKRAADGGKWWTAGNSSSDGGDDTVTTYSGKHTHTVTTNASTTGEAGTSDGHTHFHVSPFYTVCVWKRRL